MTDARWYNPPGMPDDLLPYSLAVNCGGLVRTAGLVGMDYTTGAPASHTDFAVQVRATLENLRAVLAGAGTSLERVLETSCYLHDMGRWDEMNAIYVEYFTPPRPVRTTIETRLVPPYLFEISAVAVSGRADELAARRPSSP
jgi:2-iminobutanoate/2-iminopropanoate deaminase